MHLCDLLTVPSQSAKNAPFETRRATLMRADHFRIERPFLEPRRLGRAAPLLADPHREAADQVPLKDEVDDHGGERTDQRAGHEEGKVEEVVLRDRGESDGDRTDSGRLEE